MYDLAIIGAGPAGIASAKEARKLGFRPLLIEKDQKNFGGICLNRGCIPAKYLINAAKSGIGWDKASQEKNIIVRDIKLSAIQLLQKQGVEVLWGEARFLDRNSLEVNGETIVAQRIIIATGSQPKTIPGHPAALAADELFRLDSIAGRFLIVGAGYIGIEVASLLHSLGKDVCVVEKEKNILPAFDPYLSNRLKIILQKKGIRIETEKNLKEYNLERYDAVIAAVGRSPNTAGLGLANVGVICDAQGYIQTNEYLRTNVENIYACGDVTGKNFLAYTAEYQGRLCVENIKKGPYKKEEYRTLPLCVFSTPSLAKVGILEEEAKRLGITYKVIQTNFLKFSSSYVYGDKDGFMQLLLDENDVVLGAGVISNIAAELISTLAICVQQKLKLSDLKQLIFIHPTLSEIITLFSQEA